MNNFAKLEKFLSQYNYTKFYDCRKSNARVRPGSFLPPPPYKLGGQNTPYKLALKDWRGGEVILVQMQGENANKSLRLGETI